MTLSAREYGDPLAPHVVLVHGYPDDQSLWDDVVPLLRDDFHVVTYDVRGQGESDAPKHMLGYRNDLLIEDLKAVVERVVPAGAPFHLVGHDWGAIQMWQAADGTRNDPWLRERLASFTAMCGPSLDHVGRCLARGPRLVSRRMRTQVVHSFYVWVYQLPLVPTVVWRTGRGEAILNRLNRGAAHSEFSPHLRRNALNGMGLYRANILQRLLRPRRHGADIPILWVQATHDRFVTPVTAEELERCYPNLRRAEIDALHWIPRERPDEVAGLIREQVGRASSGTRARARTS